MEGSKEEITSASGCFIRVFAVLVGPALALVSLVAAALNDGAARWWGLGFCGTFALAAFVAFTLDKRAQRKRASQSTEAQPL